MSGMNLDDAHALIIGIAGYQRVAPLPVVQDASAIAALLTDPAYCGYPVGQVRLLQETAATGQAIRAALAELATETTVNSTLLVYFSGHGARIVGGQGAGEYLLPVEADPTNEATLAATAIAGTEFNAAVQAIPARQVLIILDCCHAAGLAHARDLTALPLTPGLSNGYYTTLAGGRGRAVLASARADEFAYVLAGADYGLFTEHLLGGLRGGAASDDGLIHIFDLFEYLQPRVTGARPDQHPIFKAELEENFAIARRRGGESSPLAAIDGDFRYDAYVSYVDQAPDGDWVWETLLPRLEAAGLRIAVSNDSAEPGVARVVNIERGIAQAKRTLIILSPRYLEDQMTTFEAILAMQMGLQEGSYRLLPLKIAPLPEGQLPVRLSALTTLDLTRPARLEREFERLITALKGPLPR